MASLVSMSTLPLELIEKIIYHIAVIDISDHSYTFPNAKACSLTCKTFLRPSRKHIFRSVRLFEVTDSAWRRIYPNRRRRPLLLTFANLITANEDIASCVRDLHYIIPNPTEEIISTGPSSLERLINLEILAIYGECRGAPWDILHSSSRSPLLRLMQKPTIVTLKFHRLRDLTLSDLIPCTRLESLHLRHVTFSEKDTARPAFQLRDINSDAPTAALVVNKTLGLDLMKVKKVTILVLVNNAALSATLLKCFVGLEHLRLSFPFWTTDPNGDPSTVLSMPFPFLETLRSLSFDTFIPFQSMVGIPQALKKMAGANRLESLSFRFSLPYGLDKSEYNEDPEGDCSMFEDILLGPGWSFLVHIHLTVFAPGRYKQQVLEAARRRLPRLLNLPPCGPLMFEHVEVKGIMLCL